MVISIYCVVKFRTVLSLVYLFNFPFLLETLYSNDFSPILKQMTYVFFAPVEWWPGPRITFLDTYTHIRVHAVWKGTRDREGEDGPLAKHGTFSLLIGGECQKGRYQDEMTVSLSLSRSLSLSLSLM